MDYSIGVAGSRRIDREGVTKATVYAIQSAYRKLKIQPNLVIIDGKLGIKLQGSDTICMVKGDATSFAVASASIVAKVVRDRIMRKYHKVYPVYNFAKHKGYPTREHKLAVLEYGYSPVHRKSYRFL